MKSLLWLRFLGVLCFLLLGSLSWGVDHYVVSAPRAVMIGGREFTITVDPRQSRNPDPAPHRVKFVNLPPDVQITPNGGRGVPVEGLTKFTVFLNPSTEPGPMTLRVQKSNDSKVQGSVFLIAEKPVARFALTPAGDSPPRVGQPVFFQVVALDESGAVVTSYQDPVDLTADVGEVEENQIPGESFQKGVARVNVRFSGGNPSTGFNRLNVAARFLYAGQQARASGAVELSLQPTGSAP